MLRVARTRSTQQSRCPDRFVERVLGIRHAQSTRYLNGNVIAVLGKECIQPVLDRMNLPDILTVTDQLHAAT